MTVIQLLFTITFAMISVTFLTLLERKSLAFTQLRKGPNKLNMAGLTQPMADAMKLSMKAWVTPLPSNTLSMFLAPTTALTLSLILWHLYPTMHSTTHKPLSLLLFISVSAMTAHTIIMVGWSTNSKYALLGATRAMAQTISYEIPLILILIFFSLMAGTLDMTALSGEGHLTSKWTLATPMTLMWLVVVLAEVNRIPFDFTEGESELVSGFNVDYSGMKFATLVMSEYLNLLFMSLLSSALLTNSQNTTPLIVFVLLLTRSMTPRYRYDLMMDMAWKSFTPMAISFILPIIPIFLLLNK